MKDWVELHILCADKREGLALATIIQMPNVIAQVDKTSNGSKPNQLLVKVNAILTQ